MDKSHRQAQETRKRNEQLRRERLERERLEITAKIRALREIRDNSDAAPATRLEAIKLLERLEEQGYSYIRYH